ncbi:outer membrane protein [Hyphomicrobium sp. 99]|uniref:outer membrane protein n=1 Tax=Hyphomicrobium sp. 99 TaxID=1163419 RepID=UPI000696FD00|nr:outer membrane protein [Hyphomicrobium sp. 99]
MKRSCLSAVALVALSSSSFAADLGKLRATPAISPLYDWSGSYVGLQAGYSRGHVDYKEIGYDEVQGENYFGGDSQPAFVGGGHAGYNIQRGALVYGVEGDVEFNDGRNTWYDPIYHSWGYKAQTGWQGSARVRLGYAFDHSLVYATGGLAVAEFSARDFCDWCDPPSVSGSMNQPRVGWTVGGGMQYALNDRWSVRTEYRYTDFGSHTEDVSVYWDRHFKDAWSLTSHAVRFGVSYALGK